MYNTDCLSNKVLDMMKWKLFSVFYSKNTILSTFSRSGYYYLQVAALILFQLRCMACLIYSKILDAVSVAAFYYIRTYIAPEACNSGWYAQSGCWI